MQVLYSDVIAAVKRCPRMAEINSDTALDRLQDVLTDVILHIPEASVRAFGISASDPIVLTLSVDVAGPSYFGDSEVPLNAQVSQILAVYLRKSADSSAYARLSETNLSSLSNDVPDWHNEAAGTPTMWYPKFLSTGEMAVGLYPRLSSTVLSAGWNRLHVYVASPDYDITGSDIASSDPIPWALYPGWVLEAGLALRLAYDFDPANVGFYGALYNAEVLRLQERILTMPEKMKAPTIANARSY